MGIVATGMVAKRLKGVLWLAEQLNLRGLALEAAAVAELETRLQNMGVPARVATGTIQALPEGSPPEDIFPLVPTLTVEQWNVLQLEDIRTGRNRSMFTEPPNPQTFA